MEEACIFCKIVAGEVPATFVHRDAHIVAIADVNPQAPTHLLVLPLAHSRNIADFTRAAGDEEVARLVEIAARLGREHAPNGFRLVINTGHEGGQTVDHLHVHVLGGRFMMWPPG